MSEAMLNIRRINDANNDVFCRNIGFILLHLNNSPSLFPVASNNPSQDPVNCKTEAQFTDCLFYCLISY